MKAEKAAVFTNTQVQVLLRWAVKNQDHTQEMSITSSFNIFQSFKLYPQPSEKTGQAVWTEDMLVKHGENVHNVHAYRDMVNWSKSVLRFKLSENNIRTPKKKKHIKTVIFHLTDNYSYTSGKC